MVRGSIMDAKLAKQHTRYLRWAELQFLLAQKVGTLTLGTIRLDQPVGWSYGDHFMSRDELTLTYDDATLAAAVLHHSATFTLAVHIVGAFKQAVGQVRDTGPLAWQSAFEIARLIRNAYTHQPADPHWSIDPNCRDKVFEVNKVIRLGTAGLQDKRVEWQDYGGPIALYRLSEFVRSEILAVGTSE